MQGDDLPAPAPLDVNFTVAKLLAEVVVFQPDLDACAARDDVRVPVNAEVEVVEINRGEAARGGPEVGHRLRLVLDLSIAPDADVLVGQKAVHRLHVVAHDRPDPPALHPHQRPRGLGGASGRAWQRTSVGTMKMKVATSKTLLMAFTPSVTLKAGQS